MIVRFTSLLIFVHFTSIAQINELKTNIEQLCKTKKATIGVCIYGLQEASPDTLTYNGNVHFPMQSVFKFHIALTLLKEVDKGNFSLDQKIHITKKELRPKTWSPLRDDYPEGNVELPLATILSYTISKSDNNGCDILLRQLGGTKIVGDHIHNLGIKDFAIEANEEEMDKEWNIQFKNWTTPQATTQLLKMISQHKIITQKNNDFLRKIMLETVTGPNRLKKLLPENAVIAHKTGTSGTNEKGITAAVNDIGIIKLANGNSFAISVFICNSSENMEMNEQIIADIAKLATDYFSKRHEKSKIRGEINSSW